MLEDRGQLRGQRLGLESQPGKALTWRLDDGRRHVEAQPGEVSQGDAKLPQGALDRSLREGDVALALRQLGEKKAAR